MLRQMKTRLDKDEMGRKKRRLSYQNPLPKRLSVPPSIIEWREIVSQLESWHGSHDDSTHALIPIHKVLLVHMGFSLVHSAENQPNHELLFVLFQCWRCLYHTAPSLAAAMDCFDRKEAFELLDQILKMHHNAWIAEKCLEIVDILMAVTRTPLEDSLLFSVFHVAATYSSAYVSTTAGHILKQASLNQGDKAGVACIMYMASRFIQAAENADMSPDELVFTCDGNDVAIALWKVATFILKQNKAGLSEALEKVENGDLSLFLCCLSLSPTVATALSKSELIIEALYSMAMLADKGASEYASRCLSSIMSFGNTSSTLGNKIVSLFTNGSSSVKRTVLRGLLHLMKREPLSFHRDYGSIIKSAQELTYEKSSGFYDDLLEATASLLSVMALNLRSTTEWSPDVLGGSLVSLAPLLQSDNDRVVNISIKCIRELSSVTHFHQQMALHGHLLDSVAHVAKNEFLPWDTRYIAVETVWNLAQSRANRPILTRTPKVLEALVAVVSSGADGSNEGAFTSHSKAIRRAVRTLLTLPKCAADRRIVAKQVGLLACLIRFTRSMTLDDETLVMPKEEMKVRILELAKLL